MIRITTTGFSKLTLVFPKYTIWAFLSTMCFNELEHELFKISCIFFVYFLYLKVVSTGSGQLYLNFDEPAMVTKK